MEIRGRSMLTLKTFKNEIKDFIIRLTSLMEGRLHPLLIEPSQLSPSYKDLVRKAHQAGLAPLNDDPLILLHFFFTLEALKAKNLEDFIFFVLELVVI